MMTIDEFLTRTDNEDAHMMTAQEEELLRFHNKCFTRQAIAARIYETCRFYLIYDDGTIKHDYQCDSYASVIRNHCNLGMIFLYNYAMELNDADWVQDVAKRHGNLPTYMGYGERIRKPHAVWVEDYNTITVFTYPDGDKLNARRGMHTRNKRTRQESNYYSTLNY